jgi:hypothetical protein
MPFEGLPVERLRDFLRELKPASQSLLIVELERSLLRGEDMPGTDLVLRELRRTMRESGRAPPRIGSPARLFFRPFEPFLVDDVPDHQHRSRIARLALDPLWNWICRDVMPAEAKLFSDEVSRLLLIDEIAEAEALARGFQENAAERMAQLLSRIRLDPKATGRLSVQLGSMRAAADVECAVTILRHNPAFMTLSARLPSHIRNLADPYLSEVHTLLDSPILPRPDLLPFGLVMVMNRLAAPWQLVRLATRAAGSDAASRITTSPYAVAVSIVLDEVERLVGELRSELKTGRRIAVIALLKSIHDAARGLRTEIDLSTDSPWSRQLSALRTEVSNLVKAEVESMPGRVRRLLRPRPADDIAPGSELDANEVAETEAQIAFVDACRHFASELAVNEMTLRACTELQQYLDNGRQALLDGLRNAGDRDRAYRQSQLDAAVRFCRTIFGPDYAAVLVKAGEVAASPERKAMRA